MPSSIAWVDTTPAQHRAARELVALFSQPDTRDELGVGQVRDVLSNLMFPGITVLQTRARYYLFVPWCYQVGARRSRRTHTTVADAAHAVERELIRTLLKTDDTSGLIGGRVGDSVVNLPSAMFWVGLEKFGIVRQSTGMGSIGRNPRCARDLGALPVSCRRRIHLHGVPRSMERCPPSS